MSTPSPEAAATVPPETDPQEAPRPTETVEFWKAKAREQERRAKDNATAAQRLTEIEEANKTEVQKASERLAEAERKAIVAEARVLRRDVALEHKLTSEDASLLDTITDEDAMRKLAVRLAGEQQDSKNRNHVPREGSNPRPGDDPMRSFARDLFGAAKAQN